MDAKEPREAALRRGRRETLRSISARHGLEAVALLVLFGAFFLLKTHGLHASVTDENVYFYAAAVSARGVMPYRDFFFAHPPLHLLVPALLYEVFGFGLLLSKLVPVVAAVGTGALLYAIARRAFGVVPGLVALVAYFFAEVVLNASTNLTGVNLTTAWWALGLWLALGRRFAFAGAALGAATGTGLYVLGAALGLVVLTAFADRRALLRTGAGFLVVVLAWNAGGFALGGDSFIASVYTYHFRKPDRALLAPFLAVVAHHPFAFASFLATPVVVWAHHAFGPDGRGARAAARLLDPRTLWSGAPIDTARIVWLTTAALGIQFAALRELYAYYFALWMPTLALLGSGWAHSAIHALAALWRRRASNETDRGRRTPTLVAHLVTCVGLSALIPGLAHGAPEWVVRRHEARAARGEALEDETGLVEERIHHGERVYFRWSPAPVLPELDGIVRALFWSESRVRGRSQPGFRWYLQEKKTRFSTAEEIARYVAAHSQPGETLTGASAVAPLVALLSGRDLARHEADTNSKRFYAEMPRADDFFRRVCRDRLRFVIGAPASFFTARIPSPHPVVRRDFRPVREFLDPELRRDRDYPIVLFERITPDRPVGEPVCAD